MKKQQIDLVQLMDELMIKGFKEVSLEEAELLLEKFWFFNGDLEIEIKNGKITAKTY